MLYYCNAGIFKRVNGDSNQTLSEWTSAYNPSIFLLTDCVLLFTGLAWICNSLKHDPQVMGNEKYMAAHSFILILMLASYIYAEISKDAIALKINDLLDTLMYFVMGYIMNTVNL
jgi:hypothetical protein